MNTWLQRMHSCADRRSVFLESYALTTCTLMATLESDDIRDPDWAMSLLDLLADYYFATLEPVHPFPSAGPPAWEVAHRLSRDQTLSAGDSLLLGMNAHINNDLPQALAAVLQRDWPMPSARLARRRQDFWAITDVIAATTDCADARRVFSRIIRAWRMDAWETALALVTSGDAGWESAICEDIEHAALKRAHLIACSAGFREHLVAMPNHELHRAFDRHRTPSCRCGIGTTAHDSWSVASA